MITPKELRIGNIVFANCITKLNVGEIHTDQDVVVVSAIDSDSIDTEGAWSIHGGLSCLLKSENEWVSGITITPQWLINFGFIEDNEDYVLDMGRKCFRVAKAQYSDLLLLYREDIGLDFNALVFVEYIHHLQNIVFDLTEAELTANQLIK
jgi:hypothetical protein